MQRPAGQLHRQVLTGHHADGFKRPFGDVTLPQQFGGPPVDDFGLSDATAVRHVTTAHGERTAQLPRLTAAGLAGRSGVRGRGWPATG
ncbi:hypothetical protein ADK57_17775 [Streptomyces sp. MMG1533]|nr:hypothetical protein ADK57_17775 [Streptomyces sp. MMG1533]